MQSAVALHMAWPVRLAMGLACASSTLLAVQARHFGVTSLVIITTNAEGGVIACKVKIFQTCMMSFLADHMHLIEVHHIPLWQQGSLTRPEDSRTEHCLISSALLGALFNLPVVLDNAT